MKNVIRPKRSLGQHFLTSDTVPKWMCETAKLSKKDLVLEIGPGTGVLTEEILKRAGKVLAIETDPESVSLLNVKFSDEIKNGKLTLVHSDIRDFDINDTIFYGSDYKIVANIPYYMSGWLFRRFLTDRHQPSSLVFLVQKEVAKRICCNLSKGEKESLLSISVKAYGQPYYTKTVSRQYFKPKPKVDSGIVLIKNISKDNFYKYSETDFFSLVRLGFSKKRKQLVTNLTTVYDKSIVLEALNKAGLSPNTRAEDVSLDKWFSLYAFLHRV